MTARLRIEGWAARFEERDLHGDVLSRTALSETLFARAAPVAMLYQHVAAQPIGRWTRLAIRPEGLYARGEIFTGSARGAEIAHLIEGGALDGLSIGYEARRARRDQGGRRILQAALWEISIVTFPMALKARILRARAVDHASPSLAPPPASERRRLPPPAARASDPPPSDARSLSLASAIADAARALAS